MVLVTGATGHIGNVLTRELVSRGELVRALVLPGDDASMIECPGVEVVRGDIRDEDLVTKLCDDVEIVYHLAALISIMPTRAKLVREVNIGGTNNIIAACKRGNVKRLVYTGSIHAFAEPEIGGHIDENVPFNPIHTSGVYGKSKAEAAINVLTAAREGLDAVMLCPTGVIGPFDYKLSEMGNLVRVFAAGKLKVAVEGSFDFVDVRDVVEGELAAAELAHPGEVYILGGEVITVEEIVKFLSILSAIEMPKYFLKSSTARFLSYLTTLYYILADKKGYLTPYSVHTLTRNYTYSHEKAAKFLGYNPRPVRDSLRDSLNWLNEAGKI